MAKLRIVTSISGIAQSGLAAATVTLDASASNVANADDTSAVGSANGYQPLQVQQSAVPGGGVVAQAVTAKPASLIAYDPGSPVANPQGFVDAPEIDPISEVSNQLAASHAFAFSLKVLQAANKDEESLFDITT